ncbi:hypothetical protein A9Q83_05725 [Alphaproteobacteria bacterium 46_93_T64]|nr:hypothetical protein A9Q83_05725 [Alphaproteobacteria bacterium 46_93_T64]
MDHTGTLFVGLDCGGTQCRARLTDSSGKRLGEGAAGPANALLGMDVVFAEIKRAVAGALKQADMSDVPFHNIHAGIGMAGLCSPEAKAAFDAYTHIFKTTRAETDAHIAQLGAFGGNDGAILIIGTGSCGYAVVREQTFVRGGHGFLISDHASGAYLGRMALRRAVQGAENILPRTSLCDAILSEFDYSVVKIIDWAKTARPTDYGAFVPRIFELSGQDDLAVELIEHTVKEVELLVKSLLDVGANSVVLVGGMAEPLMPWLSEQIKSVLAAPMGDALDGACLLAEQGHKLAISTHDQTTGGKHA